MSLFLTKDCRLHLVFTPGKQGLNCFELVHFQLLPEVVENAFDWITFVV